MNIIDVISRTPANRSLANEVANRDLIIIRSAYST